MNRSQHTTLPWAYVGSSGYYKQVNLILLMFQASKEWKIISSYSPDPDVQVGSNLLIEVPLEDATGMHRTPFNVEMYKVSFL